MSKFSSCFALYDFLHMFDLPRNHWTNKLGWFMAEHMYLFVKEKHKSMIQSASYIALTTNKFISIGNKSWIAVHLYVI